MKTYPETTPQALKTSDAFLAAVEGLTVTFWEMILCTYFVKKDVLLQKKNTSCKSLSTKKCISITRDILALPIALHYHTKTFKVYNIRVAHF